MGSNAFKVVGVICLPMPPSAQGNVIGSIVSNPGGLGLSQASTSLGHAPNFMCMKLTRGENESGLFDLTLKVTGDNPPFVEQYYVKVYVFGGPLLIEKAQLAEESPGMSAFKLHGEIDPDEPQSFDDHYPWYCTDLGYNPFNHRGNLYYRPDSQTQRANVFKARPRWSQPNDIKVWYALTAPGTFLNPNSDLSTLTGSIDPRMSKGLPSTTSALIANEPDSTTEFSLAASYGYSPGAALPNPPAPGNISDSSASYMNREDAGHNGIGYNTFKPHRPISITRVTPPYVWDPPGYAQGLADFFQVRDDGGAGMPGVWVQERYPNGSWPLEVNPDGGHWVTRRAGNVTKTDPFGDAHDFGTISYEGVFGPDWIFLLVEFWDYYTEYWLELRHDYFAATSKTTIGATPAIFLATYFITFWWDGESTHSGGGG